MKLLWLITGAFLYIMATLSWFGCPYIVRKRYREVTWRKAFQRDMVLPFVIGGFGFILTGLNTFPYANLITVIVVNYLMFKVWNKYI
ncbi:MAG: hypothetical protein VB035_05430 [Candidatus Fimivivens sp.]|nr:hypothetical protein [Candidatus Fimivivens sp.]